jgi:hypothetical protein
MAKALPPRIVGTDVTFARNRVGKRRRFPLLQPRGSGTESPVSAGDSDPRHWEYQEPLGRQSVTMTSEVRR